MGRNASNLGLSVALLVGVVLVAFPWMGGGETDKPVPSSFVAGDVDAAPLFAVLAAHDRACQAGDVDAFAGLVTRGYHGSVARSVAAVDRRIDAALLKSRVENGNGLAAIAGRSGCRGKSAVDRACILGKPAAGMAGTVCIALSKDGGAWRIDRVAHLPQVALDDETLVAVVEASLLQAN